MSDHTPPAHRPVTEAEAAEFRALGLTAGHWAALAPVPLFRPDLRAPERHEFRSLQPLRQLLRTSAGLGDEAERFWHQLARGGVRMEVAYALLGWHLATDLPRARREEYLELLERSAEPFRRGIDRGSPVPVVRDVRRWVEAYLPTPSYSRHPQPPRIDPPDPVEVAKLLGADLWKQTLTAPLAAALTERGARPGDAFPLVRRLAYVTERGPYNRPEPLEQHLTPGWLTLFGKLLEPGRTAPVPPLADAVRIAARGLATLGFDDREAVLQAIGKEIRQAVYGADRERFAAGWVGRVREMVEEVLWAARGRAAEKPAESATEKPTEPRPEPKTDGAKSEPAAPVARDDGKPKPELDLAATLIPVSVGRPGDSSAGIAPTRPAVAVSVPLVAPPPRPTLTVRKADPFATATLDEALAAAGTVSVAAVREWLADPANARRMLFDDCRLECPEVAIVRDPKQVPKTLWVVGDVHADVLTLANIIRHAAREAEPGEPPAFLFLGDFVDRGRHDHETLLLLFSLIIEDPGRVCVVPGNHDIDLRWGEKDGRFGVTIEPAEYCERLNGLIRGGDPAAGEQVELAKLLIPFWQQRPKAVVLPDGTMYSHGGFPHTDTHASLRTPADLGRPACQSDFLWARVSDGRRKRPNRGNRGHEFGWDDFAQFCRKTAEMGMPAVRRLVRGHDHVPNRWQLPGDYAEFPVLTVNAMGRRMESEPAPGEGDHPLPVMARHVPGQLPEVVRLPLDPAEVDRAFGRERRKPDPEPTPLLDLLTLEADAAPAAPQDGTPGGPADEFGGPRVDPPAGGREAGPGGGR